MKTVPAENSEVVPSLTSASYEDLVREMLLAYLPEKHRAEEPEPEPVPA